MLVNKAEAYPSEIFQPYFKDKTSVYMADSYKGTSLLQAGTFVAVSHWHTVLMLVRTNPSETFQPYFKDKTRVYMADSYKDTSLLHPNTFVAVSHLHSSYVF